MAVLKLIPAGKDYLWGGTKLVTDFGKKYDGEKLAEAHGTLRILTAQAALQTENMRERHLKNMLKAAARVCLEATVSSLKTSRY